MTTAEYTAAMNHVALLGTLVEGIPLAELTNHLERLDTLGPVLEPTAYRDHGMRNVSDSRELVEPLLEFQRAVRRVKDRVIGEGRGQVPSEHQE